MSGFTAMPTSKIDLQARAQELRAKLAGYEDEWQRGRRRLDELDAEYAENRRRHQIVSESQQRMDDKIAAAREEVESIEALIPDAKPKAVKAALPTKPETNDTEVREAILRFREFTVAEFAALLHVTKRKAQECLDAEVERGIVRATGQRFGGSPQYEYVPPTDEGEAFRVQQAARGTVTEPTVYADAVAGVGDGYLHALPKDVRKVARMAMRDGWSLVSAGSGHYALVQGNKRVTVSATPQSPSAEATQLRRRLKGSGMTSMNRRHGT